MTTIELSSGTPHAAPVALVRTWLWAELLDLAELRIDQRGAALLLICRTHDPVGVVRRVHDLLGEQRFRGWRPGLSSAATENANPA